MGKSTSRRCYVEDARWGTLFHLHESTFTIVNPNGEVMFCCNNCIQKEQYIYGGVKVRGSSLSIGFVFKSSGLDKRLQYW